MIPGPRVKTRDVVSLYWSCGIIEHRQNADCFHDSRVLHDSSHNMDDLGLSTLYWPLAIF